MQCIIVPEIIAPFANGVGRTIIDTRSDTHLLVGFARLLPDKKIATSDWPAPNLYKNSEQNSTISEMGDFFKY